MSTLDRALQEKRTIPEVYKGHLILFSNQILTGLSAIHAHLHIHTMKVENFDS